MPLVGLIITVIFCALLVSPASAQVALGETDLGGDVLTPPDGSAPASEPEWLAPEEPLVPEPAPVPTPESISGADAGAHPRASAGSDPRPGIRAGARPAAPRT